MRSKLVFFLALTMGLITTVLFFSTMSQSDQAEGKEQEVVMVEVIAAEEVISANQIINEDMIRKIKVPEADVHPLAVRDISEVEGKFATAVIEKDEIILTHRLKGDKEETELVSRKVQDGYRAVSVGVDIVQSVSTLIEPEDYVDAVLTEILGEGDVSMVRTELVLEEIRVLAVGRKMASEFSEEEQYMEYTTLTLELKPKDAEKLINASQKGNLHFTLHSSIIPGESD
ncbi:Flp pilus assembly protein CpaB [Evansella clarkii]|uniref:Flp pilus assembly protein CpaB n=1 Tax=Evansella clarkii TaxID=79879 RepID=UPI000B44F124|nr:Flp pilus assembly protein CpaB [Evansella clarkii]